MYKTQEVDGKTSSCSLFKENAEQLLKSSGLVGFDKTAYRVIKLTAFDGRQHQVLTIVANLGTYITCEFLGQLGGEVRQYTIGNSKLFRNAVVDIEVVKRFYAEKWFLKGNQIIDFMRESTFVDVEISLIDNGLELKINELWRRQYIAISEKEDKAAIRNSIICLDYGTYRIVREASVINKLPVLCEWLQRAVILYKKHYSDVAQTLSIGSAPLGACLSDGTHLDEMVSIGVGVYIGTNVTVENYVLIHTGVQIGKDCHIGAGSVIGSAGISPGELPTIVRDNSIIGEHVVIGTGITLPKHVRIEAGVCLKDGKSAVFDRVRGHSIKCNDLAPGSVVVTGALDPNTKLVCPCVISYDGLPRGSSI